MNVKGENAHPMYQWINDEYNKSPKWNFYKYLFDRSGSLVESWSSMTKPDSKRITKNIDKLI
jgi:glutathione peroxidase